MSTTKNEATPRPWRLGHDCEGKLCIYADNAVDLVDEWHGSQKDAEVLIGAVNQANAMRELVEAAKGLDRQITARNKGDNAWWDVYDALAVLRAALAPWRIIPHTDGVSFTIEGQGGGPLANVTGQGPENAEHARLIAAAPDLLEAVRAYLYAIDDGGISQADLFRVAEEKARAAFAKVAELKGETE